MYNNNSNFSQDAADYLVANGWKEDPIHAYEDDQFIKGDDIITVKGDTLKLETWLDGNGRPGRLTLVHSITGIADFDTVSWMFLFHALGVVKIKDFIKEVRKESRVHPIFEPMLDAFFNHHVPAAIPENY